MTKTKSTVWYENEQKQKRYWSYDAVHDFLYYAISEVDKICNRHNIHYFLSSGTILGAVRHNDIIPWDPDADLYMPQTELANFIEFARAEFPEDLYIDFYDVNPHYIYTSPKIGKKGFTTNGLHVDIFPIVGLPRGKSEKRFLYKYEWQRVFFKIKQGNWDSRLPGLKEFCNHRICRKACVLLRGMFSLEKIEKKLEKYGSRYDIYSQCDKVFDGYRVYPAEVFSKSMPCKLHGHEYPIPIGYDTYLTQTYGDYMKLPESRSFQTIIRSDIVTAGIQYQAVVFIDSFLDITTTKLEVLDELFWKTGSIVAIADLRNLNDAERQQALLTAKSLRFFDKVLVNDKDAEQQQYLIELVHPDKVVKL